MTGRNGLPEDFAGAAVFPSSHTVLWPARTVSEAGAGSPLTPEPGSCVAVESDGRATGKLAEDGRDFDGGSSEPYGFQAVVQLIPAGLLVTVPPPQPSIHAYTTTSSSSLARGRA